jgi:hypothetical protein
MPLPGLALVQVLAQNDVGGGMVQELWPLVASLLTQLGFMMYPFVKTETGRFLKCMCLLPNRRTPWAFTCSQHCRLAPGGFVPLP